MKKKILKNIESQKWRYAKTMPENPHFYTLCKDWDDQDLVDFVLYIRENGYTEKFKGQSYTYLNLNGYKYWTMGYPIDYANGDPCTILINCAEIKD